MSSWWTGVEPKKRATKKPPTGKPRRTKKPVRSSTGHRASPAHVSQKRLLQQTFVYMMHSLLYFWKTKWGISDEPEVRRGSVDHDVDGDVFFIFPPQQIPFGWQAEQFVHRFYSLQNAPMKKGTGRTEWYLNLNLIVGNAVIWYSIWIDTPFSNYTYGLAIFSPIIWLDGLLWMVIFRLFWWAVTAASLYFVFKIICAYYGV